MKKYLSKLIRNHYKAIFRSISESSSKIGVINNFEITFKKNTYLGKKKDQIFLLPDEIISPYVLKYGYWDYEIIKFIKKYAPKNNLVFLDIGANIGLISKQLLCSKIKFEEINCFEPDITSFKCLKKNLNKFSNVNLYNFGLGKKNKKSKLFINPYNSGDSSFIKKGEYFSISKIVNINSFFSKNFRKKSFYIFKSDTQGMDEEIFINIKEKYFKQIKIAIIEISNSNLNNNKIDLFIDRVKNFRVLKDKDLRNISINQIKNKINRNEEFDLLMSK